MCPTDITRIWMHPTDHVRVSSNQVALDPTNNPWNSKINEKKAASATKQLGISWNQITDSSKLLD